MAHQATIYATYIIYAGLTFNFSSHWIGYSFPKRVCAGATSTRLGFLLVQKSNCLLGHVSHSIRHRVDGC